MNVLISEVHFILCKFGTQQLIGIPQKEEEHVLLPVIELWSWGDSHNEVT